MWFFAKNLVQLAKRSRSEVYFEDATTLETIVVYYLSILVLERSFQWLPTSKLPIYRLVQKGLSESNVK